MYEGNTQTDEQADVQRGFLKPVHSSDTHNYSVSNSQTYFWITETAE